MKKDRKNINENIIPTQKNSTRQMPVKNNITDDVKNTASQTNGLNQAATSRDDLFPSDGDNLTQ